MNWTNLGQIFAASQGQYSTLYWPWILDSEKVPLSLSFPNRYIMYYSTDHREGGIAVATSNHLEGTWTNYGQVFNDTGPGFSTETPTVWYDEVENVFRMFYQQAGIGTTQATLQAVSSDGLNWTKLPQANGILVTPGEFPGDGHTGYAIVFDGPGENVKLAYHLMGGGHYPHFGMSISKNNGLTWRTDPRPLLYGYDAVYPLVPGYRIEWNSGYLYEESGIRNWIGLISNFSSGGMAVSRHIVTAPVSEDGRRFIDVPTKVFPSAPAANLRAIHLYREEDEFYLFYQIGNVINLARRSI